MENLPATVEFQAGPKNGTNSNVESNLYALLPPKKCMKSSVSFKDITDEIDKDAKEDCTKEPSEESDVDLHSTDSVIPSDVANDVIIPKRMEFPCRYIRIGSFEGYPINDDPHIPIFVNNKGFYFSVSAKLRDVHRAYVVLEINEIQHIDCQFDNFWAQYMFIHITPEMSKDLQFRFKDLKIYPPIFDFEGKNVKIITFLLDELSPVEIKQLLWYLKYLFPAEGAVNEKITWEEFNKILSAPTSTSCLMYTSSGRPWFIILGCRHIIIGSRKIFRGDKMIYLHINSEGFSFGTWKDSNAPFILKYSDISNLAFYLGEGMPALFVRTSTAYAKSIGFHLHSLKTSSPYLVSAADLEMQHRIIFYLRILTKGQATFMRDIFRNSKVPLKEIKEFIVAKYVLEKFTQKPPEKPLQTTSKISENEELPSSGILITGTITQCVGKNVFPKPKLCKKDSSQNNTSNILNAKNNNRKTVEDCACTENANSDSRLLKIQDGRNENGHCSIEQEEDMETSELGNSEAGSYLVNNITGNESIYHIKIKQEKGEDVPGFKNSSDINAVDISTGRNVLQHSASTTIGENIKRNSESSTDQVIDICGGSKLIFKSEIDIEEPVDANMFSIESTYNKDIKDNMQFIEGNVNVALRSDCFIPQFYSPSANVKLHEGGNLDESLAAEETRNSSANGIVIKTESVPLSTANVDERFFHNKEARFDNHIGNIVIKMESELLSSSNAEENVYERETSINNHIVIKTESEPLTSFNTEESLPRKRPSTSSWLTKTHSKLKSQEKKMAFVSHLPHAANLHGKEDYSLDYHSGICIDTTKSH